MSDWRSEGGSDTHEWTANRETDHQIQAFLHSAKVHCWFSWDDQTLLSCMHISSVFSSPSHSSNPILFPPFLFFFIIPSLFFKRTRLSGAEDTILQNLDSCAAGQQLQRPYAHSSAFDPITIQVLTSSNYLSICNVLVVVGVIRKAKSLWYCSVWPSFDLRLEEFSLNVESCFRLCITHDLFIHWLTAWCFFFSRACSVIA